MVKMLCNEKVCDFKDVEKVIETSSIFGWSWSKENKEPYRHTAIALYFDENPRFTVNFRPENGASKAHAAFSECREVITIESVDSIALITTKFFPIFEEFSIIKVSEKNKARNVVEQIISISPGQYNLVFNNCRDHVKAVVNKMKRIRPDLDISKFSHDIGDVRDADFNRYLGAAAGTFTVLGTMIAGAAAMVSWLSNDNKEDEEEQVAA